MLDLSFLYSISNYWSSSKEIRERINLISQTYIANKPECLDHSKCLLETVCKTVIQERTGQPTPSHTLNKIFADALRLVTNHEEKVAAIKTDLFNAKVKLVENLGRFRNEYSLSSHGHEVDLTLVLDDLTYDWVISGLLQSCLIIFNNHTVVQSDGLEFILHTRRDYDSFEKYNDIIDDQVVNVKAEDGVVYFNDTFSYRYSEILFRLDKNAYRETIMEIKNSE